LNSSKDLCTKLQQEQLVSSLGNNNSLQQNIDSVSSGCIACEMQSIVRFASSELTSGFNSIVPANLLYAVWNYADHMAGYDQQDAHEFLIALLDGLGTHLDKYHPETIQPSDNNKIQSTTNNYGAHSTFVNDIFSGCMKSNLHCGFCCHQRC
jgi:ubiquitin carboxyl-terminal hydrolase 22/27/51